MSNVTELKKRIYKIVSEGNGDSFDDAYNIYKVIVENDESFEVQVEAFRYACEIYGTIESDEKYVLDQAPYKNEKDELKTNYGEIVNSLMATYFKKNCPEEEFYSTVWKIINESLIFVDEKSKVFAIYYILIDARIPYFMLEHNNMYSLSNDKYTKLRLKYIKNIQKIRFIIKTDFSQKTEKASSLLAEFGINIPAENATIEEIEIYERKLMQMVEILPQKKAANVLNEIVRRLG